MRCLPIVIFAVATLGAGVLPAFAAAPNPAESRTFLSSGMQKDNGGDFDGAIADYTRAVELDPKNGLAYVRRGMAHDNKGEMEDAIKDYAAALATKNMERDAEAVLYSMRADTYLRQDMRKEAIADFDRALAINPKLFQANLGRGITRLMVGDFAKAQTDYEAALKERPDDAAALYGMGIIAYWKQDWKTAESRFTGLQKKSPDDPNVAIWAILSQRRNGKTVNATEYKTINQAEWPGQVVAHLFGTDEPLEKFISEAEEHHDTNEPYFSCIGSFTSFSLAQIEKRVDIAHINDLQTTFQKCAELGLEGHIALNEIKLLKAR